MGFSRQEYWNGLHALLQGIFSTQGLNGSLLPCRQILYQLSYHGSLIQIFKRDESSEALSILRAFFKGKKKRKKRGGGIRMQYYEYKIRYKD